MTTLTIAPTQTQTVVNPLALCDEYHRVLSEIRKDIESNRGEHTVTTEDIDGRKVYDMFYKSQCYLVVESTNKSALKRLQSTYTVYDLGGTISDMFEINWTSSVGKNKSVFSVRLKSHIEIMDQQEFIVGYMEKEVKRYKKGLLSAIATLESVAQREYPQSIDLPKLRDSGEYFPLSYQIADWEKLRSLCSQLVKKVELCDEFNPNHRPMWLSMWVFEIAKLLDTSESLNHKRFDFTQLDRNFEQHLRWFLRSLTSKNPINPQY